MKILIIANYADGLYLFRKELMEAFLKDGNEVYVSVPEDENCTKLKKYDVKLFYSNLDRHGVNPFKDLKLFMGYVRLIRRLKPDYVLTYTIKPNVYGGMAARLTRVPYVCNVTGLGIAVQNGGLKSSLLIFMQKTSMSKAARVFFQNEENMRFMQGRGVAVKNAELLPGSGVNLDERRLQDYPSETNGIRFLAVLRIMRDKGVGEYLEAASRIKKRHPEVSFELAGAYEDDEKARFEPKINELASNGTITYLGVLNGIDAALGRSHVVIHPSYHEGLSNVVLESAAAGRPLLVSNVPGCIEGIDPGVSGFTFEPKDARSLEEAIERMLGLSEDERRQMGLAGRSLMEKKFDRQMVIQAYKNVMYEKNQINA